MKLPRLRIRKPTESQKLRFKRWLVEWEIEQELRLCDNDETSAESRQTAVQPLPVAPLSGESEVRTGQIRLLSPEAGPLDEAPVYIAVLDEAEPGMYLTPPYGRFSEPCTPGELSTNRQTPCLRVLCLWNTQKVRKDILSQSWVVDELTPDEINDALDVLNSLTRDSELPHGLETRIGPPVWHPDDPRARYMAEEARRMKVIFRIEQGNGYGVRGARQLPLAAEPHSPYETDPPPTPQDNDQDAKPE
jgi:hypothetical protein